MSSCPRLRAVRIDLPHDALDLLRADRFLDFHQDLAEASRSSQCESSWAGTETGQRTATMAREQSSRDGVRIKAPPRGEEIWLSVVIRLQNDNLSFGDRLGSILIDGIAGSDCR
jgi:hypothetical protein